MAVYFCSGALRDPAQFRHYALNVPLYTHFTSPIRRFADVLVHRLLASALGKGAARGGGGASHAQSGCLAARDHSAIPGEASLGGVGTLSRRAACAQNLSL